MKVMVIVKGNTAYENGQMADAELLTAMGKYNEDLVAAGIMVAGEGIKPTRDGARVKFSGTNREVERGPFGDPSQTIAGFWLWNVKDLDEAIAWVKKAPNPMHEDSEIDIRPIFSAEDFADADPTGEIMAREAELREKLGQA